MRPRRRSVPAVGRAEIYNLLMDKYPFARLESEVQRLWDEKKAFQVTETPDREKFYCLSMFPYPSGKLHMGHVRNYTIGDAISRYWRMRGRNVLQPMGWDAFGLPAENAAMEGGIHPGEWTWGNIGEMRSQLQRLGFAFDWTRELATCSVDYYRWEQVLISRLFRSGLVYRKTGFVNWDPVDQTVLANEQVIDGRGWRSGALVEQREVPMYFMRITAYADELLEELDRLEGWPDSVKVMQRNWIGKSLGLNIGFSIEGRAEPIRVFTTRPDTLMGTTYLALAPRHPIVTEIAKTDPDLEKYVRECETGGGSEAARAERAKTGRPLKIEARNPIDGSPIPVWVANYVLLDYGPQPRRGAPLPQGAGETRGTVSAARLGHFPPTLLGMPDPGHPLREVRHRGGPRRRLARAAAGRPGDPLPEGAGVVCQVHMPRVRRRRQPRDGHDGHFRRILVVFRPLRVARLRDRNSGFPGRLLDAGRPVYRRH